MRYLLPLLLLSACGPSLGRLHVYELPKDKADVIWLTIDGKIHRCWHHGGGYPVCIEARVAGAGGDTPPRPAPVAPPPQAPID